LLYGALIFDAILPTRARWNRGYVLLTCGGGIGSQRADDVGAACVGFNVDEDLSWRCSGPKVVRLNCSKW
jgi:hypothetical protein